MKFIYYFLNHRRQTRELATLRRRRLHSSRRVLDFCEVTEPHTVNSPVNSRHCERFVRATNHKQSAWTTRYEVIMWSFAALQICSRTQTTAAACCCYFCYFCYICSLQPDAKAKAKAMAMMTTTTITTTTTTSVSPKAS